MHRPLYRSERALRFEGVNRHVQYAGFEIGPTEPVQRLFGKSIVCALRRNDESFRGQVPVFRYALERWEADDYRIRSDDSRVRETVESVFNDNAVPTTSPETQKTNQNLLKALKISVLIVKR